MPAGRPKGSRNAFSRQHKFMLRLSEDERGWLMSKVTPDKSASDVIRGLMAEARKREESSR